MAVAVESNPEDSDFINLSTDELLTDIYQDYQPSDVLPDGISIESPWGSLIISATALGERAVSAYFNEDMELDSSVLPLSTDARAILIDIVKHQRLAVLTDERQLR